MELDWIWKAMLIVIGGTFLLRIAGRKSISQMTLPQTVLMIGIGSLLIQPVAGANIWQTLAVGAVLVLTLLLIEYSQIKGNLFEKIITGKSKVLIENGQLNEQNLKRLRLTVDQLEMNLRVNHITSIEDVEWATLEPNGQVGFTLKKEAQTVTKKEFQQFSKEVQQLISKLGNAQGIDLFPEQENLFTELDEKRQKNPSPKHLQ